MCEICLCLQLRAPLAKEPRFGMLTTVCNFTPGDLMLSCTPLALMAYIIQLKTFRKSTHTD